MEDRTNDAIYPKTTGLTHLDGSLKSGTVWRARSALFCYIAVVVGVLIVAIATGLGLRSMGVNLIDPPYPLSLVSIPVNEITMLLLTLVFARKNKVSIRQLGLRGVSIGMILKMMLLAVAMLALTSTIAFVQQAILGPDPSEQLLVKIIAPRNLIQLMVLVAFLMLLVGPVEELFARGYVQQGLEESYGKVKGWLLASFLFGIFHGLNTPRAVAPTLVAGLALGLVWQRTGRNTTAVSLMHGIYDSIALALMFLAGGY